MGNFQETMHDFTPETCKNADLLRDRQLWVQLAGNEMFVNARSLPPQLVTAMRLLIKMAEKGSQKDQKQFAAGLLQMILQYQFTRMLVEAGETSIKSNRVKEYLADTILRTLPRDSAFAVDPTYIGKSSGVSLPDNSIKKFITDHPGIAHAAAVMPLMAALTGVGVLGVAGGFALGQESIRTAGMSSDLFRKVQDLAVVTWATYHRNSHMDEFMARLYIASCVQYPDEMVVDKVIDNFHGWSSVDLRREKPVGFFRKAV